MESKKPNYEFSADKNQHLIQERDISFEDVIASIDNGQLLETVTHYNVGRYPNQEIYIININGYVYLVPFVRKDKHTVFLKTGIPSRKLTKKYLGKIEVYDEEKT